MSIGRAPEKTCHQKTEAPLPEEAGPLYVGLRQSYVLYRWRQLFHKDIDYSQSVAKLMIPSHHRRGRVISFAIGFDLKS
jgi:hypothetical protein